MWQDTSDSDCSSSEEEYDDTPVYAVESNGSSATVVVPMSSEHEDVWCPEKRTTIYPTRIRLRAGSSQELRDPVCMTESPRTGLSPHGFTLKTWAHNFKRAVASENIHHTSYCLASYFVWFFWVELLGDNGVRRVVPLRNPDLLASFQEQNCAGGVFNNRWSAFLHQQLQLLLYDTFFELVGVVGANLLRRINELWIEYELSLFCVPIQSLSKLLTIGKVLVDAHKHGGVFFTAYVFQDTALVRRRREQVVSRTEVVRAFHKADNAERVISTLLQAKPVYFKQRHRKNLYRECFFNQRGEEFLNTGNVTYLLQALPLTDKKASKVFAVEKECVLALCDSEDTLSMYNSMLSVAEQLYYNVFRRVNNFACRKLSQQVLMYDLVYVHLLSGLARDGVNVWASSSFQLDEVSHKFSQDLFDAVQNTSVPMIYGVLAQKASNVSRALRVTRVTTQTDVPRAKKRKVSVNEQEDIRANCGPTHVAISHQHAYAGSKCHDGYFHPADFVSYGNYATDVLPHLEAMYYTVVNFGSLARQYKRLQSVAAPKSTQPFTDSVVFDFNSVQTVSKGTHIVAQQKVHHSDVVFTPFEDLIQVWSGAKDSGDVLFDFLCGNPDVDDEPKRLGRNKAWIQGPFAPELDAELVQKYAVLNQLRTVCGLEIGDHSLTQLVVQDCPLKAQDVEIVIGNPYTFYTEQLNTELVFHQGGDANRHVKVTRPVLSLIDTLQRAGVWKGTVESFSLANVVVCGLLIEAFGDPSSWDTCFACQQLAFVEKPTFELRASPLTVIPTLKMNTSPSSPLLPRVNSLRNSRVWEPIARVCGDPVRLQRLIDVSVEYLCQSLADVDKGVAGQLVDFFGRS